MITSLYKKPADPRFAKTKDTTGSSPWGKWRLYLGSSICLKRASPLLRIERKGWASLHRADSTHTFFFLCISFISSQSIYLAIAPVLFHLNREKSTRKPLRTSFSGLNTDVIITN